MHKEIVIRPNKVAAAQPTPTQPHLHIMRAGMTFGVCDFVEVWRFSKG